MFTTTDTLSASPTLFRLPLGILPLVMGKLGDSIIFASETVAFDVVGAEHVRSIEPGELVIVTHDGEVRSHRPFGETHARPCIFEHVSFSRPDSVVDEIGRASCRERVCPYVSISVVAVSLKTINK